MATTPSLEIGSEVGPYRIEQLIGRGGMGVVYRATDMRLGRPVALKLLSPEYSGDRRFRARFERESRLSAQAASGSPTAGGRRWRGSTPRGPPRRSGSASAASRER